MRVVVIDNYDSFVYNLVQLLGALGAEPVTFRNDRVAVGDVRALRPDRLLISPGPGTPEETGVTFDLFDALAGEVPILGVCLGHQAIARWLGGRVDRAERIMHGKTSPIHHDGKGLFAGVPSPFPAARYHSLIVDPASLPDVVRPTAWTDRDELMGIAVPDRQMFGVQFHPESFMTDAGEQLLGNFLGSADVRSG